MKRTKKSRMKRTYKQIKEEKNKQTNYREIERTNK